jgi:hypothetical protein
MAKLPCPVCGDPNAFPIWIDEALPPTCPHDPAWPRRMETKPQTPLVV